MSFSDEEVNTLYLIGVINKIRELKKIYAFAARHLRSWFAKLSSHVAHAQRLNKAADVFAAYWKSPNNSEEAKVAPELAEHEYCSTKKLFYPGVRVHIVDCDPDWHIAQA